MSKLQNIVYLSREKYETLLSTGTVDNYTYNADDLYLIPDEGGGGGTATIIGDSDTIKVTEEDGVVYLHLAADLVTQLGKTLVVPNGSTTVLVGGKNNAQENITIGSGLSLSNGTLSATASGGGKAAYMHRCSVELKSGSTVVGRLYIQLNNGTTSIPNISTLLYYSTSGYEDRSGYVTATGYVSTLSNKTVIGATRDLSLNIYLLFNDNTVSGPYTAGTISDRRVTIHTA